MLVRGLTGTVLLPSGETVATGRVLATALQPVPASPALGVLVPASYEYSIADGEIDGEIVAPARYKFEVYVGSVLVWRFIRVVAEAPTPTTLQAIYLDGAELPDFEPDALYEGSLITLLSSGSAEDGQVATADGAGGIGWTSAESGDMTKAVYDTNDDGVVGAADAAPWAGITGKPATFPPDLHAVSHAAAGADVVTPAAIGAAETVHTHAPADVTPHGYGSGLDADTIRGLTPWEAQGLTDASGAGNLLILDPGGHYINAVEEVSKAMYAGFPQLSALLDGTLVCLSIYGPGDLTPHTTDHTLRMATSADGGLTWSAPVVIDDHPTYGSEVFAFITLADGTLLAGGSLEDNSYDSHGAVLYRSTDDGVTWTRESAIDPGGAGNWWVRGLRQLASGDIVAALNQGGAAAATADSYISRSTDAGLTWSVPVKVADGAAISKHLDYGDIVECASGDLLYSYVNWTDSTMHVKRSSDGGATWGAAAALGAVANFGRLLVLSNGWIVAAGCLSETTVPIGFRASRDDGATWSTSWVATEYTAGVVKGLDLYEVEPGLLAYVYTKRPAAAITGDVRLRWASVGAGVTPTGGLTGRSLAIMDGGAVFGSSAAPASAPMNAERLRVETGAAAMKGLSIRGASGQSVNFLEVLDSSGNELFSVPSTGGFKVQRDQNAVTYGYILNNSTGAAAKAQMVLGQLLTGNNYALFEHLGSNFSTSGLRIKDRTIIAAHDSGGMAIFTNPSQPLILGTGATSRMEIAGAGAVSISSSLAIGSGGAALTRHLSATASLDFAQLGAGGSETLTIAVTGAADGDVVALGIPHALASHNASAQFTAWVSAADTVSVRRTVIDADGTDPAAATVRAAVWKY